MKLSTFLLFAIVVAITLIIVKSNPSQNLLPFLSGETSSSTAPASERGKRFSLAGRVTRHFGDGHIIVNGTLTEAGGTVSQGGDFALIGRPDSSFLTEGTPINCEVSLDGDYQFQNKNGTAETVKQFVAATSAPGASRAGAWMSEGNPLDRPAYGKPIH